MKKILIVGNNNISSLISDKKTIEYLMEQRNIVTMKFDAPKIELTQISEPILTKKEIKDTSKQFYKFIAK
jgi:hypothetical protein